MKKKTDEDSDEMRPEYDLRELKFVGRGIYAKRLGSGTTKIAKQQPSARKTQRRNSKPAPKSRPAA